MDAALREIPPAFAEFMQRLVIDIEQSPDEAVLAGLDINDPTELLGLYQGTPLTDRSVEQVPAMPDRVIIYQRNIEAACNSHEELIAEIRATVLHEVGHHFGLDEDELESLGYG